MVVMRVKAVAAYLLLVAIAITPALASAASDSRTVEAAGSVAMYNGATHSGLWAAGADFKNGNGNLVSVFKSSTGDIFVVSVKGDRLTFDDNGFTVAGTGFLAKNGVPIQEGNSTAWISKTAMKVTVNGNVEISGQTVSFTVSET
jgi:hypothetical protein